MRSRFTVSTLAALICGLGCGGGHSTAPSPPTPPAHTPVGTATGPLRVTTIGPGGGVAMSDDSRMRVVVPAGALGSDVDIGVQLITAEAPGATGPAYRLTPEGMTFNTPVNLVFQYDSVDLLGTAPELLWIASQQADGSWLLATGVVLDPGSSTLSVPATHFSDWTRLQGLQIRPPEGKVKPGESLMLSVENCTTIVDVSTGVQSAYAIDCEDAPTAPTRPGDDELPPLPTFAVDVNSWSVNGIRGGSPTYGHVAGQAHVAEFVAPATAPTSNNVAVSVKAHTYNDHQVVQLVANIEIELVCGPQGAVRMVRASGADDVCSQDWIGTSSTVFFDANPLYRVEAMVRWNYDTAGSAQAGPGISVYYPTGTARVTATDPCIQLSPNSLTWNTGDPGTGGGLRIDYNQAVPSYSGNAGAVWLATGTDTCDPESTPQQVPVGGPYFFASGVLEAPGFSRITGTNSAGGQTFTFTFDRIGTVPPSRAAVRSRHR